MNGLSCCPTVSNEGSRKLFCPRNNDYFNWWALFLDNRNVDSLQILTTVPFLFSENELDLGGGGVDDVDKFSIWTVTVHRVVKYRMKCLSVKSVRFLFTNMWGLFCQCGICSLIRDWFYKALVRWTLMCGYETSPSWTEDKWKFGVWTLLSSKYDQNMLREFRWRFRDWTQDIES